MNWKRIVCIVLTSPLLSILFTAMLIVDMVGYSLTGKWFALWEEIKK